MAINKVIYGGNTLIDITDTTATASTILSGYGAYGADGSWVDGSASSCDTYTVTYNLSGGAYSNVTPSTTVANEGFSAKLKVPTGYALSGVTVTMGGTDITSSVMSYESTSGSSASGTTAISITENGTTTHDVTDYASAEITVNVDTTPTLQSKSVSYTPTTSSQLATITADSGYDGLSDVSITVDAIPSMWLPPSAELVASAEETINLSTDTSYDSWTPTTTNTSILSVGTTRGACYYKITTDYQDTALIGFCLMRTELAYPDGTSYAKGYSLRKNIMSIAHYAPFKDETYSNSYYGRVMNTIAGSQQYYSSSSATTIYTGTSYSVGATTATWTTSSTTSTSARTVGWTRPIIYARCNSTYFSTTAAAAVDSANSNIYCYYRIYKIDKTESPIYAVFDENNGIFYT